MDARIIPSEQLGIKEGDSHVIRNAGGRTPDALRSLIISQQLLGTQEIVVIQHTDCGMVTFKSKDAIEITKKNLNLSSHPALDTLDFLEFPEVEENVRKDVEWLKNNELIKSEKVSGWVVSKKETRIVVSISGVEVETASSFQSHRLLSGYPRTESDFDLSFFCLSTVRCEVWTYQASRLKRVEIWTSIHLLLSSILVSFSPRRNGIPFTKDFASWLCF